MHFLTDTQIVRFAAPIGRVALAYSELEIALSQYLLALRGLAESTNNSGDEDKKPISRKLDDLKDFKKNNKLPKEIRDAITSIKGTLEIRNIRHLT